MAEEYTNEIPEERPRRSLASLIGLLVIVVVVIFILLQLRGCGASSADESSRGGKTIEAVEGYVPVAGAVSVWIAEDRSIDEMLRFADVQVEDYVDMGGGRYIIDVEPGTEDQAAETLADMKGVYDAGRVYENPK